MKAYSESDFEGMLCDTFEIEVPVSYDDMQNKKLRISNLKNKKEYILSFSSKHKHRLTLDTFLKLLQQKKDLSIIGKS